MNVMVAKTQTEEQLIHNHYQNIVEQLEQLLPESDVQLEKRQRTNGFGEEVISFLIHVDGYNFGPHLTLEEQDIGPKRFATAHQIGARRPLEKRSLFFSIMDDRMKRKAIKQKKDGSFSYDKIASDLAAIVHDKKRSEQLQNTQKQNRSIVSKLAEKLGLTGEALTYRHQTKPVKIRHTANPDKPVHVIVEYSEGMTPEQAEEFIRQFEQIEMMDKK